LASPVTPPKPYGVPVSAALVVKATQAAYPPASAPAIESKIAARRAPEPAPAYPARRAPEH